MRRASITTCATRTRRRRSGRRSRASRPGCGATARPRSSSTGCAQHNAQRQVRAARRLPRPRSVQPVHLDPRGARLPRRRRSAQPRRSRDCATAASRPGRRIRRPTAMRRSPASTAAARTMWSRCSSNPAAQAAGLRRARRRALPRRRAERAPGRERRALLPDHVLRLARSRGTCATATCSTRCRTCCAFHGPDSRGRRLGAQLARRRRRRDRDVRRAASSTSASCAASDFGDAPMRSASAPTTARSRRRRTGTGRCRSRASARRSEQSYERLFHASRRAAVPAAAAQPVSHELRTALQTPRLERAIGVIYRPETELQSHYFQAVLPEQFDEYVWFDRTHAVTPLDTHELHGTAGHLSVRRLSSAP